MVKNLTANAGDTRDRFDPWVGKIPWSRKYILQYSCLENSTDRGTWQAIVHEVAKSRTQQHTHTEAWRAVSMDQEAKQGNK